MSFAVIAAALLGLSPDRALAFGKARTGARHLVSGSRARAFPYSMIGLLLAPAAGGTSQCTAVRVSRRVILTAAHCFYSVGLDGEFGQGDEIGSEHIYRDPVTGNGYSVERFETGTRYDQGTAPEIDLDAGKDWAVAVLEDSARDEGPYLTPLPENVEVPIGAKIAASGFSTDMADGDVLSEDSNCSVLSLSSLLMTSCQMWEGASGGPDLYRDASGKTYIIGTHTMVQPKAKPPVAFSTPISSFREALAQTLRSLGE